MTYRLDCGAYTDISPYMAKAIAVDCTGPYHLEHLSCDALCVYTNHTYATSYRSFAHESYTFCMERMMDILAHKCGLDPLELRIQNAIHSGSLTPTQVVCTDSLMGNLTECLNKVKSLSEWDGGQATVIKQDVVRAKGVACLWKTENPPTDAVSGAMITFNSDGSVNLNTGVVEMGSGGQTNLALILAERLCIDPEQVHVVFYCGYANGAGALENSCQPHGVYGGHAVMRAADDLIRQLRQNGAEAFGCLPEEIEVKNGRVFPKMHPGTFIAFQDIAQGYKSTEGESLGEPALGRGGFMLKGLCMLDPQTGRGKTGPAWTLGAQVIEIEADLNTFSYRIISASAVMDVGKAIHPELMRALIAGGHVYGCEPSQPGGFFVQRERHTAGAQPTDL
ncbi:MAG: xanthine dehydrogenase family protein molybdopterin-binding subunit [Oscillospiraceae bacterium]